MLFGIESTSLWMPSSASWVSCLICSNSCTFWPSWLRFILRAIFIVSWIDRHCLYSALSRFALYTALLSSMPSCCFVSDYRPLRFIRGLWSVRAFAYQLYLFEVIYSFVKDIAKHTKYRIFKWIKYFLSSKPCPLLLGLKPNSLTQTAMFQRGF